MPGYFLALPGFVDPTVAIALFLGAWSIWKIGCTLWESTMVMQVMQ